MFETMQEVLAYLVGYDDDLKPRVLTYKISNDMPSYFLFFKDGKLVYKSDKHSEGEQKVYNLFAFNPKGFSIPAKEKKWYTDYIDTGNPVLCYVDNESEDFYNENPGEECYFFKIARVYIESVAHKDTPIFRTLDTEHVYAYAHPIGRDRSAEWCVIP